MEQNIRFKGLSLTPDELAAENGTLSLCANCELHDGALRPSVIAGTELPNRLTVTKSVNGTNETKVCKLLYVHKTPAYTHLIAVCPEFSNEFHDTLHWFNADGSYGGKINDFVFSNYNIGDEPVTGPGARYFDIEQVESIGNTLIVLMESGVHYVVWKADTETYKYLGRKPPFVKLAFSLSDIKTAAYDRSTYDERDEQATVAKRKTGIAANNDNRTVNSDNTVTIAEAKQSEFTTEVWALLNKAHHLITEDGGFYTNFLVRYCYRMYDGTMIYHSAPMLMPVSLPENVIVRLTDNNQGNPLELVYTPSNVRLTYRCENQADHETLQADWADVISSIDIFVSLPMLKNNDGEKIEGTTTGHLAFGLGVSGGYIEQITPRGGGFGTGPYAAAVNIPGMSDGEYAQKIRDCANFYKVKSFLLEEDLHYKTQSDTTYVELDIPGSTLLTLAQQEQMEDDYKSHNYIAPVTDSDGNVISKLFTYNRRLNISAVKELLFMGFDMAGGLMPVCLNHITDREYYDNIYVNSVYVEIQTDNGRKIVKNPFVNESTELSVWAICYCLFFYPDSRAVATILNYTSNDTQYHRRMRMEPCLSLNGAVVKDDMWGQHAITPTGSGHYTADISRVDERPNTIYTSSAGNPFHFPPQSIYTVGTGTILGLASTTRAISQGQFGQYPLMAFATDGVWALDVSATGTFSSVHPISREVCSNPGSICQLDQQVVMVTARGMSVVTEQNVKPISEALNGVYLSPMDTPPGLYEFLTQQRPYPAFASAFEKLLNFANAPIDYFQEAKVVYDFTGSRLLVYKPQTNTPIYVYSISDGTWSTMATAQLLTAVSGYPYPYLEKTDGTVTVLDQKYPYSSATAIPTVIITRALSFGDAMYTLGDLAHNRMMTGVTYLVAWGSNDLVNWRHIGGINRIKTYYLPGRAFRYFRFAIVNIMTPGELYISTSFNAREKFGKL